MTNSITIEIPTDDLVAKFGPDVLLTLAKDNGYQEIVPNPDYVQETNEINLDYVPAGTNKDGNPTEEVGTQYIYTAASGEPTMANPLTVEQYLAKVGTRIMLQRITEQAQNRMGQTAYQAAIKDIQEAVEIATDNIVVTVA